MEAIGQLTGGIAHDFDNLLGVIIGNVEYLIDALRDIPQHAKLAEEILESALSGADLTRRLLAFARRQTLRPRRIDLNACLPNHVMIIRRLLGETVQLAVTLAKNLWPTRADPSEVGDALLNLAINARDAMPHGGRIQIRTANAHLETDEQDLEVAQGDYVVLSVTDTGTGMPPEVLERAVKPFFTTKGPGAGSGLGLSMIFGFAKQSGAHLGIESEPGHGTTVRLYLPRALGFGRRRPQGSRRAAHAGRPGECTVGGRQCRNVHRGSAAPDLARPPSPRGRQRPRGSGHPAGRTPFRSVVHRHRHARRHNRLPVSFGRATDATRTARAVHHRICPARGRDGQNDTQPGPMLRTPYRKLDLATVVREVLEA